MALTPCPECDARISDAAISCPHCGHPSNLDASSRPARVKRGGGCGVAFVWLMIISLAGAMLIAAIHSSTGADDDSPYLAVSYGKDSLRASLRDPDSVKFGHVWAGRMPSENGEPPLVACGYFNARNGFGGMTGMRRFISGRAGFVLTDENGGAVLDVIWHQTCVLNREN